MFPQLVEIVQNSGGKKHAWVHASRLLWEAEPRGMDPTGFGNLRINTLLSFEAGGSPIGRGARLQGSPKALPLFATGQVAAPSEG